jgi:hypothetical protein
MHWLWRAAVSVLLTYVVSLLIAYTTLAIKASGITANRPPVAVFIAAVFSPAWVPIASVGVYALPIASYMFLTRRYATQRSENETYCRRCGYILRGLKDPRCSECGEPI